MYEFLNRYLPKAAADSIIVLWYLLLIILVLALSGAGHGEFRYLKI